MLCLTFSRLPLNAIGCHSLDGIQVWNPNNSDSLKFSKNVRFSACTQQLSCLLVIWLEKKRIRVTRFPVWTVQTLKFKVNSFKLNNVQHLPFFESNSGCWWLINDEWNSTHTDHWIDLIFAWSLLDSECFMFRLAFVCHVYLESRLMVRGPTMSCFENFSKKNWENDRFTYQELKCVPRTAFVGVQRVHSLTSGYTSVPNFFEVPPKFEANNLRSMSSLLMVKRESIRIRGQTSTVQLFKFGFKLNQDFGETILQRAAELAPQRSKNGKMFFLSFTPILLWFPFALLSSLATLMWPVWPHPAAALFIFSNRGWLCLGNLCSLEWNGSTNSFYQLILPTHSTTEIQQRIHMLAKLLLLDFGGHSSWPPNVSLSEGHMIHNDTVALLLLPAYCYIHVCDSTVYTMHC